MKPFLEFPEYLQRLGIDPSTYLYDDPTIWEDYQRTGGSDVLTADELNQPWVQNQLAENNRLLAESNRQPTIDGSSGDFNANGGFGFNDGGLDSGWDGWGDLNELSDLPGASENSNSDPNAPPSSQPPFSQPPSSQPPSSHPPSSSQYRPSEPFRNISTAGAEQMGEQDRIAAYAWMHGMDQGLADDLNYYGGMEDQANTQMWGDAGYGRILNGEVGYSPEQQAAILRDQELNGLLPSSGELEDIGLRDYDFTSIQGNPYGARDRIGEEMRGVWDAASNGNTNLRGVTAAYQQNLDNSFDPNALRVSSDYGSRLRANTDALGQYWDQEGAAGDRVLLDNNYEGKQMGIADEFGTALNDANDPTELGLSNRFQDNFHYGPQEQQNTINQAARVANARFQNARDNMTRDISNRGGSLSPLAEASAASRLDYQGALAAADATTDATIRARQFGLNTEGTRERMRLDAARDFSDRMTNAAGQVANFRRGVVGDVESRRAAGEQFRANQVTNLGDRLFSQYGGIIRDEEALRLGAERDIANRRMQAADMGGRAAMNTERAIGDRDVSVAQFNVNTMGGAEERAEERASNRGQTIANMRSQGAMNRINTRMNSGLAVNDRLSGRSTQIANAGRADAQEGRGFLRDQSAANADRRRSTVQQRIGMAGTGFGAVNSAGNRAIQGRRPSVLDRVIQIGVGAAGALAGGG